MRQSVDYLYSLYDALVSIDVPNDKARAVVDAMERDMGTTIATKTDLQMLQSATKADLQLLRQELKTDQQLLRQELKTDLQMLRQELISSLASRDELAGVKTDIAALRQDNVLIRKEMELLSSRLVVQLGSMLVVGFGLTIAALKYFLN
jgi:hypothetical protein